MNDLERAEVMEELSRIRMSLSSISDFAWDDGRPIIGRKLDKLVDRVMYLENLLHSGQNGVS